MEEDQGLTFGEILKVIVKRIWWVVGATALALLILVLVTQLWYNKRTQTYSLNYDVIYPYSDNGKYPDGSDFLNADIISLDVLKAVKSANESLSNVDVEKMVAEDDITLSGSARRDESGSFVRTFKISVIAKYFTSSKQATEFMKAVSAYPIERINEIIENRTYGVYFSVYEGAGTYEDRINALVLQKEYIIEIYNQLKDYGSVVEVNLASLGNIFTEQEQQVLRDEIFTKRYVLHPEKYKEESKTTIAALQKQIDENNKIIKALRNERDGIANDYGNSVSKQTDTPETNLFNAYDAKIAEYVVKNAELQNQIDELNTTIGIINEYLSQGSKNYEAKAKFDEKLDKYREALDGATATLKKVSEDIYHNNSRVIFSGNKVVKEGGVGLIMGALIGVVAGLIISACVVLIIDLPKYKREKLSSESADSEGKEGSEGNGDAGAEESAD